LLASVCHLDLDIYESLDRLCTNNLFVSCGLSLCLVFISSGDAILLYF